MPGSFCRPGSLRGRTGDGATGSNPRAWETHGGDGTTTDFDAGTRRGPNSHPGFNLTLSTGAYKNAPEPTATPARSDLATSMPPPTPTALPTPEPIHNDINTRTDLENDDPTLAGLIHEVFGDVTIVYSSRIAAKPIAVALPAFFQGDGSNERIRGLHRDSPTGRAGRRRVLAARYRTYLDTWADDARLSVEGVAYRGRDEILVSAGEVWGQTPHAFLSVMSGVIHRQGGTRVVASWYGLEAWRLADGVKVQMIHRFDDTYEMATSAGGWHILLREVKTLYQGELQGDLYSS